MLNNQEKPKDMLTFAGVKLLGTTMNTKPDLKPYTIEELKARIAESERQYAAGMWQDFDEAMDEIEAELETEQNKTEIA
jgi:hypothetical protein